MGGLRLADIAVLCHIKGRGGFLLQPERGPIASSCFRLHESMRACVLRAFAVSRACLPSSCSLSTYDPMLPAPLHLPSPFLLPTPCADLHEFLWSSALPRPMDSFSHVDTLSFVQHTSPPPRAFMLLFVLFSPFSLFFFSFSKYVKVLQGKSGRGGRGEVEKVGGKPIEMVVARRK